MVYRRNIVAALLTSAGIGLMSAPALAQAGTETPPDETTAALLKRLDAAQDRLERLQAGEGDNWLTDQRAREIRAIVQDVIADADTRSSLLTGSGLRPVENGIGFVSADGTFSMRIDGKIQTRFVYNHVEDDSLDQDRWGFENRRTELRFRGTIVDETWSYSVKGGFSRSSGSFKLQDAFIAKELGDNLTLRVGQFKAPFTREKLVSSGKQLAVERSLVNSAFGGDRIQGVELIHKGESFRWNLSFNDGFDTDNTAWSTEGTEVAFTGRGEWLLQGEWDQFKQFSGPQGGGTGVMLGAAAHYQNDEYGTGTGAGLPTSFNDDEVENFLATVDLSLVFDGANLFGAFIYHSAEADSIDVDRYGVVLQGGIFLTQDWEAFARYEWIDADTTGVDDLSVLTVGATRFYDGHNAKWTSDVGYGFNAVDGMFDSDGAGWRADDDGDDGQVVVRTQLQLLF